MKISKEMNVYKLLYYSKVILSFKFKEQNNFIDNNELILFKLNIVYNFNT